MKGHIRERSPGHWAIILDIIKDGTRKRKWHSFKGTKREAQAECARLVTTMKDGAYVEANKLTVGSNASPNGRLERKLARGRQSAIAS